jgi:putative ABC transport system permease protein
MTQLAWSAAIRIAWREMRASQAKFLFVVLTGVRGFSRSFRDILLRDGVVVSQ